MPNHTDRALRRRRDARRGACTPVLTRLIALAALLWVRGRLPPGSPLSPVLLGIALLDLGTLFPIWIVYQQRMKEIQGGEEDAAADY